MTLTTNWASGLWLPLVTPFQDGRIDDVSFCRLLHHYLDQPVDGFVLAATTGEGMSLDDDETLHLVSLATREIANTRPGMPVFLGLNGAPTANVVHQLEATSSWPVDGYLIPSPYYTRPSQDGLLQHFQALASATDQPILIYNIPYRTGVNIGNDAMLELARHPRLAGVKDCSADPKQTADLLRRRQSGFAVLTGEDPQYFSALAHGADGAILASAHVLTKSFSDIRRMLLAGDGAGARALWYSIADVPALLFAEPSPSGLKHWLWREGLIDSPEVRLPMIPASAGLQARIDNRIERAAAAA